MELTDSWSLGPLTVPNRVLLAPLAGIGNWFVRLQAKRYGAGMAVSEMVSSHAIHHRNRRTIEEMLRIDPAERGEGGRDGADGEPARAGADGAGGAGGLDGGAIVGGLVSIQLFGADPEIMRSAAKRVAAAGADAIDINMGCPVPKVCKTGAGAALLDDPDRAVEVAKAAIEGGGLPVTVKLRSGVRPGETSGLRLAQRLVAEAGVAAITLHPRSAAVHHKGVPDYELVGMLTAELDAPVILTGGLKEPDGILRAFRRSGASAVMLARGALGNPWLFSELLRPRAGASAPARARAGAEDGIEHGAQAGAGAPTPAQVVNELRWTIARAVEHFGRPRGTRWMRKAYPWYVAQLGLGRPAEKELQQALQRAPTLAEVEALLEAVVAEATTAHAFVA